MALPSKKLRVGLVGAGVQGRNYKHFLGDAGSIVALADLDEAARIVSGDILGLSPEHCYGLWHPMCERENLDLVVVATPHYIRDLVIDILSHNIPIIVENPLSMSVAEAEAMVQMAEEHQVAACVNEQWLWLPGVGALRDEINRIGQIRMFRIGGKGRSAPIELARIGSHLLSICIHYFTGDACLANGRSYYDGHGIQTALFTKKMMSIKVDLHPYGERVCGCYLEVIGDAGRLRLQGGMLERLYFHPEGLNSLKTFVPPDDKQWERVYVPGRLWDIEEGSIKDPLLTPEMNPSFWLVSEFVKHLRGEAENPYPLSKFLPVTAAMELVLGT